jgi:hypothetical protein
MVGIVHFIKFGFLYHNSPKLSMLGIHRYTRFSDTPRFIHVFILGKVEKVTIKIPQLSGSKGGI